jgi:RNA polymerase sigma-70 factor (ECF subfamily)
MDDALTVWEAMVELQSALSETDDPAVELEARIRELVAAESSKLLGFFLRRTDQPEDAADLVGEVFLTLWRRADDLPANDAEARMWLYGIARFTLSTHRRTGIRRSALTAELRDELAAATRNCSDDDNNESRQAVREALDELPTRQREIMFLVHWDGFTLIEVAKILNLKSATIRSRHARAGAHLRKALGDWLPPQSD